MFRKLALLTSGALALSSLAIIAPAGAAVTPADGTLNCNVSGQADLKPALPSAISQQGTKAGKIQVKKAAVTGCAGTVTNAKFPITGGDLALKASTPPGSCENLAATNPLFGGTPNPDAPPLLIKPVAKLKLTGPNPKGETATVASLTLVDVTAQQAGTGFAVTGTVKGTVGKNAFAGRTVTTTVSLTNLLELLNCIAGADNPTIAGTAAAFYGALTGGGTPTPAPLTRFAFDNGASTIAIS